MTSAAELRSDSRADLRARLRDLALDAARDTVLESGWASVRMGKVATAVGLSRQSLHLEFGTKDDLGLALVRREADVYMGEVARRLERHPADMAAGVRDAVAYTLAAAEGNPLLQTVLTGSAVGDESLLPVLTSRSEPLIHSAIELYGGWVRAQWPDLEAESTRIVVESVVRLLLSNVVTPTAAPEQVGEDMAALACLALGLPQTSRDG